MARFIDLFVLGDGEESLPEVCDLWLGLTESGGGHRPKVGTERSLVEAARRARSWRRRGNGWWSRPAREPWGCKRSSRPENG
jgi:hypothetical protein